jgi:hypothetical protein
MSFTIRCARALALAGKYRATYSRPTAKPSAPFVASSARSARDACSGAPVSVLPKNSNASRSAAG